MDPRQVVEKWVSCFNQADADAIADFYSEDATNHPRTGNSAVESAQRAANEIIGRLTS